MSRPHAQVTLCVACDRYGPRVGLVYLPPPPPPPSKGYVYAVYAVYAISSLDTGVSLRLKHGRRDVPGSCRARSPALHVGRRDRVASAAVAAVAAAVGRRRRSSPSAHAASLGLGPSRVAAAATHRRSVGPAGELPRGPPGQAPRCPHGPGRRPAGSARAWRPPGRPWPPRPRRDRRTPLLSAAADLVSSMTSPARAG